MIAALLAVLLSPASSAAPAPAANPAHGGTPYWFKTYSTAPYKEYWSADLATPDFAKTLPKVLEAIDKAGGKLTQPLRNFASSKTGETQQLSFAIPLTGAKSLLKVLRRLGDMADPSVRASGAPIPVAEVREKIRLLTAEKTEHAAELAKVPATSAAVEEILEHLLLVEEVSQRAGSDILFDLQVRRK